MWLLLLALPVQGFAAATMLACGPNHHRMSELAAPGSIDGQGSQPVQAAPGDHPHPHPHSQSHSHPGSSEPGPVHADGANPADHHGSISTPGADAPSSAALHEVSKFKCSACAACCVGAALPAAALVFAAFAPAAAPTASPCASHVGFFTDGPDRPPRLPLA